MFKVEKESLYELEIKRSKFIAHLFPYSEFDSVMKRLREEHPKGRHFVYAFRYKNEFGQIVEGSSDDGEPKGTSGKPTLNAFRGGDMIDSGVIIVRYFGGIKLGTGGLVRAYSQATNEVINSSDLIKYVEKVSEKFTISYPELSKFEYQLSKIDCEVVSKEFNATGIDLTVLGIEAELRSLKK